MTDAETGQRGFLLTSNPAFLAPYARAKSLLPGAFHQLDSVGLSRPGGKLESLGNAKLQELETTLALAQSGRRDTALALVSSGRGKLYMDGIRAEVARLPGPSGSANRDGDRADRRNMPAVHFGLSHC